jgi:LmbE family N-acetylglucosaminyl deacetylase
MNTNDPHHPEGDFSRRDFLATASSTIATAGAIALPLAAQTVTDPTPAVGEAGRKKKTILVIEGHLDDAEVGAGGVMIQAARAGHRVVIVTVASDYSSWAATVGREEQVKREQLELAKAFGFEKRFLDGKYHHTSAADLELKRKLAEIYVELKPDVALISHHEDHWPDHRESGLAAKDAFLFAHGYAQDRTQPRCPLILAYGVTANQTYHFEPDVFYDVTDVMPEYMDLIARIEAIRNGRPIELQIRAEYKMRGPNAATMRLTGHGVLALADTIRWGNVTQCRHAVGFKTVWGERRGPQIV